MTRGVRRQSPSRVLPTPRGSSTTGRGGRRRRLHGCCRRLRRLHAHLRDRGVGGGPSTDYNIEERGGRQRDWELLENREEVGKEEKEGGRMEKDRSDFLLDLFVPYVQGRVRVSCVLLLRPGPLHHSGSSPAVPCLCRWLPCRLPRPPVPSPRTLRSLLPDTPPGKGMTQVGSTTTPSSPGTPVPLPTFKGGTCDWRTSGQGSGIFLFLDLDVWFVPDYRSIRSSCVRWGWNRVPRKSFISSIKLCRFRWPLLIPSPGSRGQRTLTNFGTELRRRTRPGLHVVSKSYLRRNWRTRDLTSRDHGRSKKTQASVSLRPGSARVSPGSSRPWVDVCVYVYGTLIKKLRK